MTWIGHNGGMKQTGMSRREAIGLLGAGLAGAGLARLGVAGDTPQTDPLLVAPLSDITRALRERQVSSAELTLERKAVL